MIGSLQLQYNRGRQAVITNELIDIITVSRLGAGPRSGTSVMLMYLRVLRLCKRTEIRREDRKNQVATMQLNSDSERWFLLISPLPCAFNPDYPLRNGSNIIRALSTSAAVERLGLSLYSAQFD